MLNKLRLHHLLLAFSILVGGCLSVKLGKELCWDLAYYHYYVAFSFFHHRQLVDFWPNSYIHQYLNPSIDFLTYFLINHFYPRTTEFLLGAIHGINLWLLFLIASTFIQGRFKYILCFILAILGMYGPTTFPGIGSFQNDNTITLFILGCVWLQLKNYQHYQQTQRFSFLQLSVAGFILGLGVGLKLTAGVFVVGSLAATFLLPMPMRFKRTFIAGLAIFSGMLITSGYWMYALWQQHHNPFFPFFNSLFHAPGFAFTDWRDTRFLPKTIWQHLFFPFYFSWDGRTADAPFRDVRFLCVYVLYVLVGVRLLWQKWQKRLQKIPLATMWLYLFFIVSYCIWQAYFSIARYLAALEMLAPLIIYLLIVQLVRDAHWRFALNTICLSLIFLVMVPIHLVRSPFYGSSFFNVRLPAIVKKHSSATVLIAYTAYVMDADPRPQSYLIRFFPHHWQFIGVPFWQGKSVLTSLLAQQIRTKLQGNKSSIYLLTTQPYMPQLQSAAKQLGLTPAGTCASIFSDRQWIAHQQVWLCPVKR